MKREEFLTRVRDAAAAGRSYRAHVNRDARASDGYVGAGPKPLERLASEINAVGGHAHLVSDQAGARQALTDLLAEHRATAALLWQHPVLDAIEVRAVLDQRGIRWSDHDRLAMLGDSQRRQTIVDADVGISSATFAIAETGSLAMWATTGRERVVSLLPPLHIALVTAEQVLPDLFDMFDRLIAEGIENLPSNVTLITGPSKTGDIEMQLTTGVHGPKEWHVIIVP